MSQPKIDRSDVEFMVFVVVLVVAAFMLTLFG